jgi:hypothetical protein
VNQEDKNGKLTKNDKESIPLQFKFINMPLLACRASSTQKDVIAFFRFYPGTATASWFCCFSEVLH